jgi:hypothetical protein
MAVVQCCFVAIADAECVDRAAWKGLLAAAAASGLWLGVLQSQYVWHSTMKAAACGTAVVISKTLCAPLWQAVLQDC